jgi:Methyltransferase FkbM domain
VRRKIVRSLKKFAFYSLMKKGVSLSDASSTQDLDRFFKMIKPAKTNHELIRIGSDEDGGYLVPNDLEGITALFSPGVENTASFELELANRGIQCFLADYSVDSAPHEHGNFIFDKKFIGLRDDEVFMRLSSWLKKSGCEGHDFILQMDIEGAEYEVLMDLEEEVLERFRMLIVEFHDFDQLFNKFGYRLIYLTFAKILRHFDIVHIHPNNSNKPIEYLGYESFHALEFTFLRKDRIQSRLPQNSFPHPLDKPCIASAKDYPLPRCWY